VYVYEPGELGVPATVTLLPEVAERLIFGGKAPALMLHVYGAVPPDAVQVAE
jgi:hypothetical protein